MDEWFRTGVIFASGFCDYPAVCPTITRGKGMRLDILHCRSLYRSILCTELKPYLCCNVQVIQEALAAQCIRTAWATCAVDTTSDVDTKSLKHDNIHRRSNRVDSQ
jgi:hypothetical protein